MDFHDDYHPLVETGFVEHNSGDSFTHERKLITVKFLRRCCFMYSWKCEAYDFYICVVFRNLAVPDFLIF